MARVFLIAIAIGIAFVFVTGKFVIGLLKALLKSRREHNLYSALKDSQAFEMTPSITYGH